MFAQRLFDLISRLIFSRWAREYEEHHGQCEDAYAARLGLLHLEVNRCFVSGPWAADHDDAFISIRVPIPTRDERGWLWGRLHLGYVVCLGEDEIRQPGFYAHWQKPRPKVVYGKACRPDGDAYFPF